jgi:hypothetical protein
MWVFHEDSPDKDSLVETVKTQVRARTMSIDHKTGRAFLSVGEFGCVGPSHGREATATGNGSRKLLVPGFWG